MWLMKVKESQQFQFFASYAIDIHANKFQPTNKAAGVGPNTLFLSSPHLCFIIVFICDLFFSRDDPLMS